jgi:tetratricopeptide (TPR) repeat protein
MGFRDLLFVQKALAIREKSLGEQHPDTQDSYFYLIELYESQANYSKALEIWKKLDKELSSITLCEKLAHIHMKAKNCQRAKYYAEQANTLAMKPLLKQIKYNIKKAKKLPPKRRGKYCKDS